MARWIALALLVSWTALVVFLTTTDGVTADRFVVRFHQAIGNSREVRRALSNLFNGLTTLEGRRAHLDLLWSELAADADSAWLFDKVARVLLRLGQAGEARRFADRWIGFDSTARATARWVEVAAAGSPGARVALDRCRTLSSDDARDVQLVLTCADAAFSLGQYDLARAWTGEVRDNAASHTTKGIQAHLAARDVDDAARVGRADDAREGIARGLRAIGLFEPATLALEHRPFVVRLLVAEARLKALDPGRQAARLLLAVAVVEKTPEHRGIARDLLEGVITRNSGLYAELLSFARAGGTAASAELAAWWQRTGLSADSASIDLLIRQRVETLVREMPRASRPFNFAFSVADLMDRAHNVALFLPFGLLLAWALLAARRLGIAAAVFVAVLGAAVLATLLELVQFMWIPRRHPDINDIWTAAAGALLGAVILAGARTLVGAARRGKKRA